MERSLGPELIIPDTTSRRRVNPMKKLFIGGIAALIAATSFAATADAGQRWRNGGWQGGHHTGWQHRGWNRHGWRHHRGWRAGVWIGGPRIVIGGPRVVIGDGCVVRKKINRYGEVVRRTYC